MLAGKLSMALMPCIALAGSLYQPENIPFDTNLDKLPTLFNLTSSLTAAQESTSDSFWTSTFATDTQGYTYFVITHMIGSGTVITRSAFLNLNTNVYSQVQNISQNVTTYNPTTGFLDARANGFYMTALNDGDVLSGLHVESNVPGVHINFTLGSNTPALINAGSGAFTLLNMYSYEWALPAASTSGTLTINGTTITLDPAKSVTWFDRQWAPSVQPIPPKVPFATIREAPGIHSYLPVASLARGGRTWTSPYTNITYHLNYTLTLQDGSFFHLEVVTGEQEIHSTNGVPPAYEGYLNFVGTYKGIAVSGYGLVEIVTNYTIS
ncbi:hypothetical protein ZTR_10639 [Talaromyces verruculosus]|nr:hypothetical protein ZTR_10639 [Talaromyces verruculosus]